MTPGDPNQYEPDFTLPDREKTTEEIAAEGSVQDNLEELRRIILDAQKDVERADVQVDIPGGLITERCPHCGGLL